jgi:hypothetical protein
MVTVLLYAVHNPRQYEGRGQKEDSFTFREKMDFHYHHEEGGSKGGGKLT